MANPVNGITLNTNATQILGALNSTDPNTADSRKNLLDNLGASNKKWSQLPSDVTRTYSQIIYSHPEILTAASAEEKNRRVQLLQAYAQSVFPNNTTAKDLLFNKLNNGINTYTGELKDKFNILPKSATVFTAGSGYTSEQIANEAAALTNENVTSPDTIVGRVVPATTVERPYTPSNEEGLQIQLNAVAQYSTSAIDTAEKTQFLNSWILSWEPTQKIGIVKVPLQKILENSNVLGISNTYNQFDDILLQSVVDIADFSKVRGRIFLPLSANKMVVIKDFSMARRNIQQTEITHGSRYFQVFTESFPEFTLQILAVKFADTAKKVKLFFDNIMKRISETSRYSGSFYLYDIIGEDIPAYDTKKLGTRIKNGDFTRYRLLPRSVKFSISADDPNVVNISVDGIIVEWEKQDRTFNISSIASKRNSGTTTSEPDPVAVNGGNKDSAPIPQAAQPGVGSSQQKQNEQDVRVQKLSVLLQQIVTKYRTSQAVRNITPQEIKKIQAEGISYIEKGDIIGVLDAYYYNKTTQTILNAEALGTTILGFNALQLIRKNDKRVSSGGGGAGMVVDSL